jgi:hypothetical protein
MLLPVPGERARQRLTKNRTRVHTYHCAFCSHLLLASTHLFHTLPTRQPPALDRAIIVPLPPPPKSLGQEEEEAEEGEEGDEDAEGASGYTLLLTLLRDRLSRIVAREDGFEKRIVWRCGRCRVVVAYQLDDVHYAGETGKKRKGRWLFVMPGAVVRSEELGTAEGRAEIGGLEG